MSLLPSGHYGSPARGCATPVHRRSSRKTTRPVAAFGGRSTHSRDRSPAFTAPETWHPDHGLRDATTDVRFIRESPGSGYRHPVTIEEVRERLASLPREFTGGLNVVQFSRMSRKRRLFPLYGMQWGPNVYLYPVEEDLMEWYGKAPRPAQRIETEMYGGTWQSHAGGVWSLNWTEAAIRDFYLNNVLIHELGHLIDDRNTRYIERERFANWFAIEYGYRPTRGRR